GGEEQAARPVDDPTVAPARTEMTNSEIPGRREARRFGWIPIEAGGNCKRSRGAWLGAALQRMTTRSSPARQRTSPPTLGSESFLPKNSNPVGTRNTPTAAFTAAQPKLILQPARYASRKPSSTPTIAAPMTALAQLIFRSSRPIGSLNGKKGTRSSVMAIATP